MKDCNFDICCTCSENNQIRVGWKADDGNHKSACFDTKENCQVASRRRNAEQTASKWLDTISKIEAARIASQADDDTPASPPDGLSDVEDTTPYSAYQAD